MVNQINNNRSSQALSGVNRYGSFKAAASSNSDDSSSGLVSGSRVDDARDHAAALKESIVGSTNFIGLNGRNERSQAIYDFGSFNGSVKFDAKNDSDTKFL